jgi:hypothetical protein
MEVAKINLLEILQEASKSPLGVIALVILAMSVVGVILFRNSEDKYKFGVFAILLIGIVSFTYASLQIVQPSPEEIYDVTGITSESESTPSPVASEPPQTATLPTSSQDSENQQQPTEPKNQSGREKGFIYLGTFRNGNWSAPRFVGASGELKVGDVITLSDARKMFECAPYRKSLFSLNYTFCDNVIGNVGSGEKVKVLKPPVSVGLSRMWVYVQEVE